MISASFWLPHEREAHLPLLKSSRQVMVDGQSKVNVHGCTARQGSCMTTAAGRRGDTAQGDALLVWAPLGGGGADSPPAAGAAAGRCSGGSPSPLSPCPLRPAPSPVEVVTRHLAHERHLQVCVRVNAARHDIASRSINHLGTPGGLQGECKRVVW